ncbi:MAG: hypothetical protein IPM17_03845 [Verrucomicrobia bacterium]|nr:hypothetical protein [Verrucomicrobiota bacterium]
MAERLQLDSGALLDARGAAWFAAEGALAVSDLNFGFTATGGLRGPLGMAPGPDDLAFRLAELLADYHPVCTVVFGDLVPAGGESPMIENAVKTLVATVACYGSLVVVTPNPDARMAPLKKRWSLNLETVPQYETGRLLFVSGLDDSPPPAGAVAAAAAEGRLRVIGGQRPEVALPQPGATKQRHPCFVATPTRLLLPAFAAAGGNDIRGEQLAGLLAGEGDQTRVLAIAGQRLLPVPWKLDQG